MGWMRRYVDDLLTNSTPQNPVWNLEKIREDRPNKWNYVDGCMISGILSLYDYTGEEKYLSFADSFLDWFVLEGGEIRTYRLDEYNLDHINPGKNLFPLYAATKKEKYRQGIDTLRKQLDTMPRTKAGNFWHKKIYPWQVWLDGLYMAQPFYMRYEVLFGQGQARTENMEDIYRQFQNVRQLMQKPNGLYCHGYDESRRMYWADPVTGQSAQSWLRALGWFIAALVDTMEAAETPKPFLGSMLRELIDQMLTWQSKDGMFYQVIDQPQAEGNYPETSGTALFSYAVLKAVRLGYLPENYAPAAENAFFGTARRYLQLRPEGGFSLKGICLVAGLGGTAHRDGSLSYYFQEPVVENDAKGVGPMLLAYTELLKRS